MAETALEPRTSAVFQRLPPHCKSPARPSPAVFEMKRMLRRRNLHSVCEEARCPNLAECFGRGTVTFMLLGDVCTRACRFCHVATGLGRPVDPNEPEQVAAAAAELGLRHVVLTSVNRDDLPDQGSTQFARTVGALRQAAPEATVEVLTPDFRGDMRAVDAVLAAGPDVYNHNIETIERLYPEVRRQGRYRWALEVIGHVAARAADMVTKSGLMVGLGETGEELLATMRDLREHGVEVLTIGQYLAPSRFHLPVKRYVHPDEFAALRDAGLAMGFREVVAGPLVRSSYHAAQTVEAAR